MIIERNLLLVCKQLRNLVITDEVYKHTFYTQMLLFPGVDALAYVHKNLFENVNKARCQMTHIIHGYSLFYIEIRYD